MATRKPTTHNYKDGSVFSLGLPQPIRLTPQQLEEKIAKGVCYSCDNKYIKGHKCVEKKLFYIDCEEEEEKEQERSKEEDILQEQSLYKEEMNPTISCNALARITTPQTIKIGGHIKKKKVIVLIDSGSTHNFIHCKIAKEFNFFLYPAPECQVMATNGGTVNCSRKCHNIKLSMGEYVLNSSMFSIPMGGANAVLGVQWLQSLDLQIVLENHSKVFETPKGLPPIRDQDHAIHFIPRSVPPNIRLYRYPYAQKSEIESMVAKMLEAGIIQHSQSSFSAPVVLVHKKDGSWCMCLDYRELNKLTVKDTFPISVIDELLDELHGSIYFTKLDIHLGYHQIRMKTQDISKIAFRTHEGHYEFLVMPFGLTNAPSTFQGLMNSIFKPFLIKFVLVFSDDILIYNNSWKDHVEYVDRVLQLLEEKQLYEKGSKSSFGVQEVDYLGHILSHEGVKVDPSKIKAIKQWKIPTSIKHLRGFLRLTGYYRKFVKNYGRISAPLTTLLKKDAFSWTPKATKAFEYLKEAMCQAPALATPDFTKTFILECDAPGNGIGVVLMQDERPISFESRPIKGKFLSKSIYEKEMLAILHALKKWRTYLMGRHFKVKTDHDSLKYFLEQRLSFEEQQKWVTKMLGYDFEIIYKKGN
eukprot:PITA_13528